MKIINYEKKEMIPLTDKEKENQKRENQKRESYENLLYM